MAVLPQKTDQAFSFTVEETVQFGRHPYQKGWLQSVTKEDIEIVSKVMDQTDIAQFKDQSIHELSGGEQRRVYLAQALAQCPDYLLLDEPTSFLDLAYQKELLDLIKQETTSSNLTVIGVFHDVNIASLYCDRLLLLNEGKTDMLGEPHHVLTTERVNRVYETDVTPLQHPLRANPQLVIEPASISEHSRLNLADGWKTYGANGMTFSTHQPLRILSSHEKSGGSFGHGPLERELKHSMTCWMMRKGTYFLVNLMGRSNTPLKMMMKMSFFMGCIKKESCPFGLC